MAKQTPSLYSLSKTFVWFAVVSLLLTGSLIAAVVMDHQREWKNWQKKFIQLKAQKTREELKQTNQNIDKQKWGALKKEFAAAETVLKAHHADYEALLRDIETLESKVSIARSSYQDLKQFQDSYRYFFEEYTHQKDSRAAAYQKKLDQIGP